MRRAACVARRSLSPVPSPPRARAAYPGADARGDARADHDVGRRPRRRARRSGPAPPGADGASKTTPWPSHRQAVGGAVGAGLGQGRRPGLEGPSRPRSTASSATRSVARLQPRSPTTTRPAVDVDRHREAPSSVDGHPEAPPLAHGDQLHGARPSPTTAPLAASTTAAGCRGTRSARNAAAPGGRLDEADVLAVGLGRAWPARAARPAARTSALVKSADRQHDSRASSAAVEHRQDIGLVLGARRLRGPADGAPVAATDPGVVPGGQRVEPEPPAPARAAPRTSPDGCTRCTGSASGRGDGRRRRGPRPRCSKRSVKLKTWWSMPRRPATGGRRRRRPPSSTPSPRGRPRA